MVIWKRERKKPKTGESEKEMKFASEKNKGVENEKWSRERER